MEKNLSPIWPGSHCLNSAKHRPLTAWNHTWGILRISYEALFYISFDGSFFAHTTEIIKLMRRTQLKKRTWWNKNYSEKVHYSENLWRCRGVLNNLLINYACVMPLISLLIKIKSFCEVYTSNSPYLWFCSTICHQWESVGLSDILLGKRLFS